MSEAARMGGADFLPGLDKNQVESALVQAFQAADPDNAGVLPYEATVAATLADQIANCKSMLNTMVDMELLSPHAPLEDDVGARDELFDQFFADDR